MKLAISLVAGVVIAAGAFFTGAVTDAGSATKLVFDKEALKVQCEKLIEGE